MTSCGKYIKAMFFALLVSIPLLVNAQNAESDSIDTAKHHSSFRFRSVQVDGYSVLLLNGITASADYDVAHLTSKTTLGLRASYVTMSGFFQGTPIQGYEGVVRTTAAGDKFRWDIYVGMGHRSNINSHSPRYGVAFGFDWRYYIIPQYFSIILKLGTAGLGLGMALGYDAN